MLRHIIKGFWIAQTDYFPWFIFRNSLFRALLELIAANHSDSPLHKVFILTCFVPLNCAASSFPLSISRHSNPTFRLSRSEVSDNRFSISQPPMIPLTLKLRRPDAISSHTFFFSVVLPTPALSCLAFLIICINNAKLNYWKISITHLWRRKASPCVDALCVSTADRVEKLFAASTSVVRARG